MFSKDLNSVVVCREQLNKTINCIARLSNFKLIYIFCWNNNYRLFKKNTSLIYFSYRIKYIDYHK